jgi:hypothetical protein
MAISIYAPFALNEASLISSWASVKLPADEFFKCEQFCTDCNLSSAYI